MPEGVNQVSADSAVSELRTKFVESSTASFMLVFVVMLLDSAMFGLSAASLKPAWLSWEAWGMWSLALSIVLLTVIALALTARDLLTLIG